MSEKYLIGGWDPFVEQIVRLVSRGYEEYCLIIYPIEKEHKFSAIDQKMIEKYNANLNKDKTYYRKTKKIANFKFIRYNNIGILFKSKGELEKNIIIDDAFVHVKKEKIMIPVTEKTVMTIGYNEKQKISVHLDRDTYKIVKATCFEYIDRKKINEMIETFNALNNLPAWAGIVDQKIALKKQIIKKLEKNISKEKIDSISYRLIISTKRRSKKAFE